MNTNPLVCVVIVTWNSEKDIKICLNSLQNQTYKNIKTIVLDNDSNDNTVSIIKENFKEVDLLIEPKNLYLTGGNNIAIKHALKKYSPEFIMVLNPDTNCNVTLIEELLKPFKNDSKVGAVGPKVKFWNNKNQGLINSAGIFFDGFMQAYDIGFLKEDSKEFNIQKEVFGVTGACILYKTEMLKQIGLYDNRIKMYLDEVELFFRAKKHNWKVIYNPKAEIGHSYMASTNANPSFKRQNQVYKAWLIIALKHYPLKSKLAMIKKFLSFKIANLL